MPNPPNKPKAKDPIAEVHQLLIEGAARIDSVEMALDKIGQDTMAKTQAKLGDMMHGAMAVGTAAMDAKIKEVDDKLAAYSAKMDEVIAQSKQMADAVENLQQALAIAVEAIGTHNKGKRSRVGTLHLPSGPVRMEIAETNS